MLLAADLPPKNQPMLVVLPPSADAGAERVIVDPNTLGDGKGRTTIDFFKPSHDGRYVAVSLSENGSEEGTVYVYDVASGSLQTLHASGLLVATSCLAGDLATPSYQDTRANPPPGDGYFYLTAAQNPCGTGGYGPGRASLASLACP